MIVIIDNYDSFTHNLYQYLSELSDAPIRVVRNDVCSMEELAALEPSHLVISPGPGRPEDAGISVAAIQFFAGRVPILGVCLGHQAIGYAFGGRIVGARRIVHGKVDRVELDGRGLFRSINSPAPFARYHSLAIEEATLPPELEVSARSPDGEIMGVRHREQVIEGVQFHPESIASEAGKRLLHNFLHYRREPFEPRVYLSNVLEGRSMSHVDAANFMEELTEGGLTDAQIAGFLVALNAKGIATEEISGCVSVLQRKRTPLPVDNAVLDTCGTGGDGLHTFNISSLTALVAAACGARVAKHGNRAVSSASGSADFYRELGMNIDLSPERAARVLDETGFVFLFAPRYHGAMRFAAPARTQLGIKTIMNLLGPLANPAGARYQLIGVFAERFLRPVAEAAARLGIEHGMVVHGTDGQDEISVCGPTRGIEFRSTDGRVAFEEFELTPEELGLSRYPIAELQGGSAADNAVIAREVLSGGGRPAVRAAVAANAGAALYLYGIADSVRAGVVLALEVLDNGAAAETLQQVVTATHRGEPSYAG